MEHDIPDYRKFFGSYHNSASGATQPIDEHMLKLLVRKKYNMQFPASAKSRGGQIVQEIVDRYFGLNEYSPIRGVQKRESFDDALRHGMQEYMTYQHRDWDGGLDAETFQACKEVIAETAKNAIEGLKEFYGDTEFEGEYQRFHKDPDIDVPTMLFQDYSGMRNGTSWQIDLKCSFPVRNPAKKDGTRTWRTPKPKTEPTSQQVWQQSVYVKATGDKAGLLFVTAEGYSICTEETCDYLKPERLDAAYHNVKHRWLTIQNLLKAANNDWNRLFSLVPPDMTRIVSWHGPEITKIAKEAWNYE